MTLPPDIIFKLLTTCIKDIMQENRQRLTKDMIDMAILEKVKRERRHSMSDLAGKASAPGAKGSALSRKAFKQKILQDMQCAQFKRKTIQEATKPYYMWLSRMLAMYETFERSAYSLEELWIAIIEQVYNQLPQGKLVLWEQQRKLFYQEVFCDPSISKLI